MSNANYPRLAVVGHDTRDGGRIALEAALLLRETFGTRVVVVHGVGLPEARDIAGPPSEADRMRTDVCGRIEGQLAQLLEERVGADADGVELAVFPGSAAHALNEVSRARNADLVVLGPHKRDGLLDFGRTARAALSAAPCDVWVQPAELQTIERVLVPFDGSDDSRRALDVARALSTSLEAPVVALQSYSAPEFAAPSPDGSEILMPMYVIEEQRQAMKTRFEEEVSSSTEGVTTRFVDGDPASTIVDEQGPADLVVMGTQGRTGLAAALLGGVTASVIKRAHGPVLAVRAKNH